MSRNGPAPTGALRGNPWFWAPVVSLILLCLAVFAGSGAWLHHSNREQMTSFAREAQHVRQLHELSSLALLGHRLADSALRTDAPELATLLMERVEQIDERIAEIERDYEASSVDAHDLNEHGPRRRAHEAYLRARGAAVARLHQPAGAEGSAQPVTEFQVAGAAYLAVVRENALRHANEFDASVPRWAERSTEVWLALLIAAAAFALAMGNVCWLLARAKQRAEGSEAALAGQQQLLRSVVDESPDPILVKDAEGRFVMVNAALAKLYGSTPHAMLGLDDAAFNPNAEQVEFYRRNCREIMARGVTEHVVEESTDVATGQVRRYHSVKKPFREAGGERDLLLVMARDVTELETARRRAETSERRLALAMDVIGEGLWDWDIASGRVAHNPAWADRLGLPRTQTESTVESFAALLHDDERAAVFAALQACLDGHAPYEHEHRLRHAEGHHLWVLDRGEVVERDAEGKPLRMIGAFTDITARHQAQAAVEQARAAAEAANEAKTRLLASMSHEIRTPIHGILGLTDLTLAGPLQGDARRHLEGVRSSARTLLVLVNDLLEYARLDADHFSVEQIAFDLQAEIDVLLQPLRARAEAKGLPLTLERDPRLGTGTIHALGDPTRLRQVLTNLLDNAIKFTAEGAVSLDLVPLEVPARGGTEARRWMRFAVRDSGRGIAPDRLDRVFEPFVQEDPTIVRQYGGSGLGLTITARLVERMGGSIRVRSEVGLGSCFEFDLPLLSEAPPAAAPHGSTASESAPVRHATAHAPLHVLLVDDSEVNRIVAEAQLLSLGCTVECVGDGGEALEVLKQRHATFGAVLMDIQLPEIDGLSATRLLRRIEASHGWRRLPVIAATAFAMTEDRGRAERAGMDAYLSKPFQAAELAQVLHRVARRSTAPGPVNRPGTPLRVVS